MKTHYIIPIFVPFAGCPNKCVFCNQNKISGAEGIPNEHEVNDTIQSYLKTIPSRNNIIIEVAYYGGSFTGLPIDIQRKLLNPALVAKSKGLITNIRLSTRSDYINIEILDLLKEYKVNIIELGVQSLNDDVLRISQRGHDSLTVKKAISEIKESGFTLGVQLMIGLPGDTKEYFYETVNGVIKLQPDFIRLYPTLVIEGTELAHLYKQGKYKPLSLSEAIELSKIALVRFNENNIPVIRIGLQPTDEINNDKILAGPFHPAFRELVEADLMKDKLYKNINSIIEDTELNTKFICKGQITIEIGINPKDHSIVRGQKNKNINSLKESFPYFNFYIKNNESISRGQIKLNYNS